MYRLSYYRFDEVRTSYGQDPGYDTVRQTGIGLKGFKLKHFEEAFTSENWIVRIYRVKSKPNRDGISYKSKNLLMFPEKLNEYKKNVRIFSEHKYSNKVNPAKKKRTSSYYN